MDQPAQFNGVIDIVVEAILRELEEEGSAYPGKESALETATAQQSRISNEHSEKFTEAPM
jgi:hypothetical protein